MQLNNMLTRLSNWLRSSLLKIKRKWWLWIGLFIWELCKHRILSGANSYLDRHSGGILSLLSFLTHNPTGIGTAIFGGTILVLVILAFFETRPATNPLLAIPFDYWRGAGLYQLQDRLLGWELAISNTEMRFHTVANNVRAKITFRHILGNVLVANPAIWLLYGPPGLRSVERASIGMGETIHLLVCVASNDAMDRYYANPPWPLQLDANHRLEFGQWHVEIELSGDNVKNTYEGQLILNANGDVQLRMER